MSRLALALVAFGALALAATDAQAYPQFQLSTGAQRCNQCHIAPAGGTLINNYGRDESADTISRGGNGGFLHGAWTPPSWLALGADFRGAALLEGGDQDYSPSFHVFPMQADFYAAIKVKSVTFALAIGARGSVRGSQSAPVDKLGARDLYLMWRPKLQGYYARLGKFMLPMGLRLAEHPAYVRRFGGQNLGEEPIALSGGDVTNEYEWHLTLHTKDPLRCYQVSCADLGAVGYYERRLGENKLIGAQLRWAKYDPDTTALEQTFHGGVLGKYWLSGKNLLFMAQLEAGARITAADYTDKQLLGHLSATWMFKKGFMLTGAAETFQQNLGIEDTGRVAGVLELQYFPWAHAEVIVYTRVANGLQLGMLQLHYYL
jgi:hypothetical protein